MGKEEPVSGNKPAKRTGIDAGGAPGMRVNGRVISYNIPEGERPGGIKVRFKIRIAPGKSTRGRRKQSWRSCNGTASTSHHPDPRGQPRRRLREPGRAGPGRVLRP